MQADLEVLAVARGETETLLVVPQHQVRVTLVGMLEHILIVEPVAVVLALPVQMLQQTPEVLMEAMD